MKQVGRILLIIFWVVGGIVYIPLSISYLMAGEETSEIGLLSPTISYSAALLVMASITWYLVLYFREKKNGGEMVEVDWLGRKKSPEDLSELNYQVDNYHKLGITKSARGQLALLLVAMMAITLLFSYFAETYFTLEDAIYSLIIYIPLAFFIYKGHRWAMFAMMILWTAEKAYQLYATDGKMGIMVLFWWIWVISLLYTAIKIENARREKEKTHRVENTVVPVTVFGGSGNKAIFCSACGTRLHVGATFCQNCGNKII